MLGQRVSEKEWIVNAAFVAVTERKFIGVITSRILSRRNQVCNAITQMNTATTIQEKKNKK